MSGKKETVFLHDLGDVQGRSCTQPSPEARTAGNQRSCIQRSFFSPRGAFLPLSDYLFLVLSTALCFAAPPKPNIRWCTISVAEENKCNSLRDLMQQESVALSCLQKTTYLDCIKAISVSGQQISVLGAEGVSAAWRRLGFPLSHL